jgi:6-phospho-3-hexuloisomerase
MNVSEIAQAITDELKTTLKNVSDDELGNLASAISGARRIFAAGAGRSRLMIRCFAMRLMHINLKVFVVGETVTPAIRPGDLLIIGSGSGKTETLAVVAEKAKKVGAKVALFTIYPDSTIGKLADVVVQISAFTTKSEESAVKSVQTGAGTFEQCLLILGDALIVKIMENYDMDEINSTLKQNHANLE